MEKSASKYLFAYGPYLSPAILPTLLGQKHKPLSSSPARAKACYLSFDIPGVPWIQPSCANCLIEGVNDSGWKEDLTSEEVEAIGDGWREDTRYKKWVWERCTPGSEYSEGCQLPPKLEGMLFELSADHFAEAFLSHAAASLPSSTSAGQSSAPEYQLHEVLVTKFAPGDLEPVLEEKEILIPALIPVLRNDGGRSMAKLQPTLRYLRLVLIPSFFTPFSRPFLAHMLMIRPFQPPQTLLTKLIKFLMLPSFLLSLAGYSGLAGRWKDGVAGFFGRREESLRKRWGYGWRNDPKVKDVTR